MERNGVIAPSLDHIHQLEITEHDKLVLVEIKYNTEDNSAIEEEMKLKMELSKAKSALATMQDTPDVQLEAASHNSGAPFKINIANKGKSTPIETHSG